MSIKKLYNELIINWKQYHPYNRIFTVPGWYKNYYKFYNQTMIMRSHLDSGYKLNAKRDEDFLMHLIFERQNSISNSGQSYLKLPEFETVINDKNFMDALSNLMLTPIASNLKPLADEWFNCLGHNNPLRINRIAAACTCNISSTVNIPDFDRIFNFLVKRNIISGLSRLKNEPHFRWFEKNAHLMREFHKIFNPEIKKGKTNSIWLSTFVWELQYHCVRKSKVMPQSIQAILNKSSPSSP